RRVRFDLVVLLSAEQAMNRLAELFAFQVPKRHVHGAHGGNGHRGAPEVLGAPIHFLPESLGLERVFAEENLAEAAGDVVAERGVDDGFDHFGRSVGLADSLEAVMGGHAHEYDVLAAGRFLFDRSDAQDLANDSFDLHTLRDAPTMPRRALPVERN